jgi:hypothetical protein
MWHRSEQGSCTCLISVVVAENVLKQTHFNGDNIENYPTCFAWHYSGFSFDDNFNVMQTIPYSWYGISRSGSKHNRAWHCWETDLQSSQTSMSRQPLVIWFQRACEEIIVTIHACKILALLKSTSTAADIASYMLLEKIAAARFVECNASLSRFPVGIMMILEVEHLPAILCRPVDTYVSEWRSFLVLTVTLEIRWTKTTPNLQLLINAHTAPMNISVLELLWQCPPNQNCISFVNYRPMDTIVAPDIHLAIAKK